MRMKALCKNKVFTTSVSVGMEAAVTGRAVWFPEQMEASEYVLFVGMINKKKRDSQQRNRRYDQQSEPFIQGLDLEKTVMGYI